MATYIILALVIVFLMAGCLFFTWKLSKFLVLPIQLVLFVLLVIVIFKVFATKENAEKLKTELDRSGIPKLEEKVVGISADAVKDAAKQNDAPAPAAQGTKVEQPKKTGGNTNFVDLL